MKKETIWTTKISFRNQTEMLKIETPFLVSFVSFFNVFTLISVMMMFVLLFKMTA